MEKAIGVDIVSGGNGLFRGEGGRTIQTLKVDVSHVVGENLTNYTDDVVGRKDIGQAFNRTILEGKVTDITDVHIRTVQARQACFPVLVRQEKQETVEDIYGSSKGTERRLVILVSF